MSSTHPNIHEPAAGQWLAIVGIGEDGITGLSKQARELIESAQIVFGGARHLSLAASLIRGDARPWSSPFDRSVAEVLAHRGRPVCVLASGDPFQYGIGSLLAGQLRAEEALTVPAVSAFSLAAARLLWPLAQTGLLSVCGRSPDLLRPHLQPGTRLLVLSSNSSTPADLAQLLCATGFGESRITVLEALGGPRERIRTTRAGEFAFDAISPLNTVAIEVAAGADARVLARCPGLADDLFEHDGQITKREVRAVTLSALAPRRGEHLWDIGAGSGSVGIEWMLADTTLSAVAIERSTERAARIRRNAIACGVPDLKVIEGVAPKALAGLRTPHAVFIGGGATVPGLIDSVQAALHPGGRLVVNAVTLETESILSDRHARAGGSLTRLEISRAAPVGGMTAWHPAKPVTQWTWVKR